MKSLRTASLIAVTLLVAPVLSAGDFGLRAGRYNDSGEKFVGAELLFDVGAIKINPNLEYSLEDNVTAGTANLDITFDVVKIGNITPYVGAGVGMSYIDDDLTTSTRTDVVGNLIGGVSFNFEVLKSYAQVKYFRVLDDEGNSSDAEDFALAVGLRF